MKGKGRKPLPKECERCHKKYQPQGRSCTLCDDCWKIRMKYKGEPKDLNINQII